MFYVVRCHKLHVDLATQFSPKVHQALDQTWDLSKSCCESILTDV